MNNQPTNTDRLRSIYRHAGPFTSVYVDLGDDLRELPDVSARFSQQRSDLELAGATRIAIDAIAARLALPRRADVAGCCVVAAADGTTIADSAHEPPLRDVYLVESLPYAAPLLEWQQRRVRHLAVLAATDAFEVASFVPEQAPKLRPCGTTRAEAVATVANLARELDVEMIIVAGDDTPARRLTTQLAGMAPVGAEIVRLDPEGISEIEDLVSAVVRAISDRVARKTVELLREFRFLLEHDGAVQDVEPTLDGLSQRIGDVLLVHDGSADTRTAWFGTADRQIGPSRDRFCSNKGRLVDVAIRSALLQGMGVRIIPSTGDRGPDGDIGLLVRDPTIKIVPAGS